MLRYEAFDPVEHSSTVADLWNKACGPSLAITARGVRYNTSPTTGAHQAGRLAVVDGDPVGFVLATEFSLGDPAVSPREMGWIDAIAVTPAHQGRGIGRHLLDWAEGWLADSGCSSFRLGGSLRLFAPGLPSELPSVFFRHRGYLNRPSGGVVWDVARDLRRYETPSTIRPELVNHIRVARPGDEGLLTAFFELEFPGRWAYEHREYLQIGGRLSDFVVIDSGSTIDGFCWLTFVDSQRPMDRCFMAELPHPHGHLGPIGVGRSMRGGGWGAALLDAGLRRLHDTGTAGCIIDWTNLLEFYAKFGFQQYRQYEMLEKVGGEG